MLKIGLTGGIGSGKSTIATLFSQYNIPIIDADIIAHQLVEPNQPALSLIRQTFGDSVFNNDDSLNRDNLRQLIFSSTDKKQQLEKILHPLIYQQMQSDFSKQTSPYCLLCIPLLIETGMTSFVDRILIVDCAVETQIARVKARSNLSRTQVLSIIDNQTSRANRLSYSHDVIDNSNSISELADQVKKLHNQYLLLSNA
ncbi:MAG: dephospho-CoA kinase [Methylococcales bacterium]|jgi:dephospho-CoA kinase|nr:dephospho-CoA kinase [Methylococcaceae bacterium]